MPASNKSTGHRKKHKLILLVTRKLGLTNDEAYKLRVAMESVTKDTLRRENAEYVMSMCVVNGPHPPPPLPPERDLIFRG